MKKTIILLLLLIVSLTTLVSAQFHDTTNLTAARNLLEQTKAVNDIVGGAVGVGLILVIYVISFVITNANTGRVLAGLGAGGFFATLAATLMLPLGLIGFPIFNAVIALFAVSIFAIIFIK